MEEGKGEKQLKYLKKRVIVYLYNRSRIINSKLSNERRKCITMKVPVTTPKPFIFVLMPFDAKFSDIYKFGIKGAAEDVDAYAERLDEQIFVEGMLDRIFNQISRADIIVADMTGRNPNVFYEVGYAHALGKITLLLTQNADDIPFDLKHRQHTVYSGSIDVLRKELGERLRWAIAESKRHARGAHSERISVRLGGLEIPCVTTTTSRDIPTLSGKVESRFFEIPLHIRNDSYDGLPGITHVYLFSKENAGVVPSKYEIFETTNLFSTRSIENNTRSIENRKMTKPLDGFQASSIDAPDGLLQQFRLDINVASLPPGAVEATTIDFIFQEDVDFVDLPYRLRLHTPSQFYDYTFRLKLEYQAPKQ